MTEHENFFNQWCKQFFEEARQERQQAKMERQEILNLLKGKNNSPGLVDEVRDNTRFRKRIGWLTTTAIGAIIVQAIIWLKTKLGF